MAISRKDALKRLEALAERVIEHLRYLAQEPDSLDVPHWRHETRNWLNQMEEVLHAVGKKTGSEWRLRIDTWRAEVEK
jgi:hypothetical protein